MVFVGNAADGLGGRGSQALGDDGLEHAEENESRGELHGDGGGGIVVEWVSKVYLGNGSFLFFFWLNESLGDNERIRCADGSGREKSSEPRGGGDCHLYTASLSWPHFVHELM